MKGERIVVALFFGLLAALLAVQIFLLAWLLKVSGSLFRTARPSYQAAFKVAALICLIGVVVGLPINLLIAALPSGAVIIFGLVAVVAAYVFYWKLIRRLLQSSGKKAFGAMVFSLGISTVGALGLAYAFRNTLFEAFVVPTGAMATTIFGSHRDVICPNCGRHFAVSMTDVMSPPDMQPRMGLPTSKPVKCDNCAQEFEVGCDEIMSGDRMIVDKISSPMRWDVVVFRIPAAQDPPGQSTNYVKRYVGLPGETLDIANGDVFINQNRVAKQPNEQLDLWFPVHDTQLMPKTIDSDTPRWEPATKDSWIAAGGGWKFSGADKDETDLQFHGIVDDRLDYNSHVPGMGFVDSPANMVGDVRILCDLQHFSGDGLVRIVWRFHGRVVQCAIRSTGEVELTCDPPQSENAVRSATGKLAGDFKSARQIGLAIRDGFAYVLNNDRVCASLQLAPTKRSDVPVKIEPESGMAAIRAGHCDVTISRIQLSRDIYYLPPETNFGGVFLPIALKPDEIFFLGDNSAASKDSRYMGPSQTRDIIGVTRAIYWPTSRWRSFP